MVTIDGKQYVTVSEAANELHIAYQAMQKWLWRHQDVPRRHVGHKVIVVRLEDVASHQKRK